jgi:hypothetical protein
MEAYAQHGAIARTSIIFSILGTRFFSQSAVYIRYKINAITAKRSERKNWQHCE